MTERLGHGLGILWKRYNMWALVLRTMGPALGPLYGDAVALLSLGAPLLSLGEAHNETMLGTIFCVAIALRKRSASSQSLADMPTLMAEL